MNKEFVTQKVAELLRLKGFDEWCWWFYNLVDDNTPDFHYSLERWTECPHLNSQHPDYSIKALMKELKKQDECADIIREFVNANTDIYSIETIAAALGQVAKEYGYEEE